MTSDMKRVQDAKKTFEMEITSIEQNVEQLRYVKCGVADPDMFQFGQPDQDPFQETDPGSKKSPQITENFNKNHSKS